MRAIRPALVRYVRGLLIGLIVLLAGCGESLSLDPLPPGSTVLAFGDSVTHGTGAGRGEDYPSLLAQRSGWQVVNAGIPGDTALAATARIEALSQQHNPALVIVELGGNDFLRRRAAADVKEDLRRILHAVKQANAVPVLVAVPEFSVLAARFGALSDAPIYEALAEEEGVFLIPDIFAQVLSRESLRADPIHPNAEGYRQMTEGMLAALRAAGVLSSR